MEDTYFIFRAPHNGPSIIEGDGVSLTYEEVEEVTQFNLTQAFTDLANVIMDGLEHMVEMTVANPENPDIDDLDDSIEKDLVDLYALRDTIEYMGYPLPSFDAFEEKVNSVAAKLLQLT